MRVLAFASQKGGSGKTTLAGHVAVAATQAGHGPVALVDGDPQGSLSDWWNAREAEEPLFVNTAGRELSTVVADVRSAGTRLLIIDTPPAISTTIRQIVAVADLVVIPTRPSPHDLRAAGGTVSICDELGKPFVFVINAATPRARITTEAVTALSHHGPVAPAILHQRVDLASSMIDGRTVLELGGARSRSPHEVDALWSYLRGRLEGETSVPIGGRRVAFQGAA